MRTASYSQIQDLDWILGTNSFQTNVAYCLPIIPNTHTHTSAVTTITLSNQGSVTLSRINTWLASILWPDQDEKESVLRERLEKQTAGHIPQNQASLHQQQIFRIKGILSVIVEEDEHDGHQLAHVDPVSRLDARRYIVQSVWDIWDIQPSQNSRFLPDDRRNCELILIGRNLKDELKTGFEQCFSSTKNLKSLVL